jgi:hypothetical protein
VRQIDNIAQLGLEHPGVERQAERRKGGKSFAEALVQVQARPRGPAKSSEDGIVAPGRAVADAANAAVGHGDVPLQHALGARTEAQVDIADDPGDAARRPVCARGTHRRNAADELGLAERLEFLGPIGAVHRAGLLEQRCADVVAAADIGQKLREQVTITRPVPQMMMGIDDGQAGFEDLLGVPREPVSADRRLRRQPRRRLRPRAVRRQSCGADEACARGEERTS